MEKINMRKKINMVKEDGEAIHNIFIGVNWTKNRYAGEADMDIDIGGFLTNDEHKVSSLKELINWRTYNQNDFPWIEFTGDNQTGDDSELGIDFNGKHYDEAFIIHSDKFPNNKTNFRLYIVIYRAIQRLQNFEMIEDVIVTICDYDNPNGQSWEFHLSDNKNFASLNAIEIGRLYRHNNGFEFQTIGSGYMGGMTELFENFGLSIDEGEDVDANGNPIVY